MDQFMQYAVTLIKDIGFPIFVAVLVLLRIEPAVKHLDRAITMMATMIAKSNGFKEEDVEKMIEEIASKKKRS